MDVCSQTTRASITQVTARNEGFDPHSLNFHPIITPGSNLDGGFQKLGAPFCWHFSEGLQSLGVHIWGLRLMPNPFNSPEQPRRGLNSDSPLIHRPSQQGTLRGASERFAFSQQACWRLGSMCVWRKVQLPKAYMGGFPKLGVPFWGSQ